MEANYESDNLYDLMKEIAMSMASGPETVTVAHALYAISVISKAKNEEILKQVGGSVEKNTRVMSAVELIRRTLAKENIAVDSIISLYPLYLPKLEELPDEEISKMNQRYVHALNEVEMGAIDFESAADPYNLGSECYYVWFARFTIKALVDKDSVKKDNPYCIDSYLMFIALNQLMSPALQKYCASIAAQGDEQLDIQTVIRDADEMYQNLIKDIEGQDEAIQQFVDAYVQSLLFDNHARKPQATYLFAGPPGVGKTFLASRVGELLGRPFRIFDMSEYAGGECVAEGLVGFEKTWKDAKRGVLTSFVENNPNSVIVFDEIEKAGKSVLKLFLQILEGARLTDKYTERTVSFEDTILIFTTNAGKELYANNEDTNLSELPASAIISALRQDASFPQELVSRFAAANIIMFNHLGVLPLLDLTMSGFRGMVYKMKEQYHIREIRYSERVAHVLLMSESNHLDARMLGSKSKHLFGQLIYELYQYRYEQQLDIPIEKIKIEVQDDPLNRDIYPLLCPVEENPIRVLYVTDRENVTLPQNPWVQFSCVKNEEEMQTAFEATTFQMIIVDLTTGQVQNNTDAGILLSDHQGVRCLNKLLTNVKTIPVYVEEHASIQTNTWRVLWSRGVAGRIAPYAQNKKWLKIMRRIYIQRSISTLAADDHVLEYQVEKQIDAEQKTGIITLGNFSLTDATEEDSQARAADQRQLVSEVAKPKVKFDDVVGAANAKKELQYFISYAKNPDKYEMLGCTMSRGILLYGPPGTGKTMLAKATAGESRMAFIATTAADLRMQGPESIKELFASARRHSPCIIFIDEIDAIGKARTGGDTYTETLLNMLLTEMDGFSGNSKKIVFVIAATNYNLDGSSMVIDSALARRFANRIYVDLPSLEERKRFIRMSLQKKGQDKHITEGMIDTFAKQMVGRSCAYMEQLIQFAVRQLVAGGLPEDTMPDNASLCLTDELLKESIQEYMHGEKNSEKLHMQTAIHEAGHAYMSYRIGETPTFMTIAGREQFGGYVQHMPNPDKTSFTRQDLQNWIRVALAGRAAEIVFYGKEEGTNTGASSDLEAATKYAMQIVSVLGMQPDQLAVIPNDMLMNTPMAVDIMRQVNEILLTEMNNTVRILTESRTVIETLAQKAMEKTQLIESEILAIIRSAESEEC